MFVSILAAALVAKAVEGRNPEGLVFLLEEEDMLLEK
jgi:hypothetical protein